VELAPSLASRVWRQQVETAGWPDEQVGSAVALPDVQVVATAERGPTGRGPDGQVESAAALPDVQVVATAG